MNLLTDIANKAAELRYFERKFIGRESSMPATVYLGEVQMIELREHLETSPHIENKNLVGEPMIMGMNLVGVNRKDYLRVV